MCLMFFTEITQTVLEKKSYVIQAINATSPTLFQKLF